ncbi:pyrroloquinoline quinone precursor peptide PqqA [Inquilinus limosus]|uniref:pyrroloquinoline quinone precursor peptide PqqA n=1 Tax=Inquilinus limosus TaxID=171674 RepID=UPI003F5CCA43
MHRCDKKHPASLQSPIPLSRGRRIMIPMRSARNHAPGRGVIRGELAPNWRSLMKRWKTPKIREIAVGCEINAYACATV